MNSLSISPSLSFPVTSQLFPHFTISRLRFNYLHLDSQSLCCYTHHSVGHSSVQFRPLIARRSIVHAKKEQPEEGDVAVMDFEELAEKDWSFLEYDSSNPKEEHDLKTDQIISAGNVVETSKVLVSIGSDDFVDRLIGSSPCELLTVVHDSIISLACIKERHDKVKCWQGELLSVPDKWAPFDVVFLYFLPALPFKLEETFQTVANRCSPGARVVISHLQGRQALEQQRKQYPDNVVSDLPEKMILEKVASDHLFVLKEYVDDPSFYLAVLELKA